MSYSYFLEKDAQSYFLFKSTYLHKNEGPAVFDLEAILAINRNLDIEDVIRDLYGSFRNRYDHVSKPLDLLRLLLANGCSLKAQGYPSLYKDHFHIKYIAIRGSESLDIEDFLTTSTATLQENLQSVADWSDNLCGCSGMFKEILITHIRAGYSIYSDSGKLTQLIEVSPSGIILSAQDDIAKFLLE